MAMPIEMSKPNVRVLMSPDASPAALRQLTYGMEEEGIPWEESSKQGMDALNLAWEAAQASRLEVGLGLDNQFVILHYSKLGQDQPLYCVPARQLDKVRLLGANAARLVKKLPLKPLD